MTKPCRCCKPTTLTAATKPENETLPKAQFNPALPRAMEIDDMSVPIRTVMYVEVGDLPANEVRDICAALMQTLHAGHPHFVVPLRNGKLITDVTFEKEVLDFIRSICEITDDGGSGAQIVLKTTAHDVDVIRIRV